VELTEHVSRTAMVGGVVDYGGKALNMTSVGYILYDPLEDPATLEAVNGVPGCTGKPTVYGNLLIVANRITGKLYFLDISDPAAPYSKGEVTLSGNPDIALVAFDSVYVPAGNAGLIRIPLP